MKIKYGDKPEKKKTKENSVDKRESFSITIVKFDGKKLERE